MKKWGLLAIIFTYTVSIQKGSFIIHDESTGNTIHMNTASIEGTRFTCDFIPGHYYECAFLDDLAAALNAGRLQRASSHTISAEGR